MIIIGVVVREHNIYSVPCEDASRYASGVTLNPTHSLTPCKDTLIERYKSNPDFTLTVTQTHYLYITSSPREHTRA